MTRLTDEQLYAAYYSRIENDDQDPILGLRAVADAAIAADRAARAEYVGWYCAHCQRGVDGSEVTFNEQHTVCGRVITDDTPPAAPASDQIAAAVKAERERIYAIIDTNPEHIWRDAGFMQWRAKRSQENYE